VTADILFRLSNGLAVLGWLSLIFVPRWRWSARLISPVLIPATIAILYASLVVTHFVHSQGGFGSLTAVAMLFQNRMMLLAGWVHYLAFDLFIGSWEVRDAEKIGIAHYLVIPCLVLTFLFGPAGWLLYILVRTIALRTIGIEVEPLSKEPFLSA